jgi:autotransporter family porin
MPGSQSYSFPLLSPGVTLPSEAFCAAHIQQTSWEPRPGNQAANARVPTSAQIAALSPWDASIGLDPRADQLRQQITGQFTGTTDEILQWVACKWGVPVDVVRAEAVIESYWRQDQMGDQTSTQSACPPGTWNGSSCFQSYGILQIMYQYNVSAWPMSRDDTAFSAEYVYGMIRACYNGWTTYLSTDTPQPGYPQYHAGDLWGCLGRWFSGGWYDQGAIDYIARVKAVYEQQVWRTPGF